MNFKRTGIILFGNDLIRPRIKFQRTNIKNFSKTSICVLYKYYQFSISLCFFPISQLVKHNKNKKKKILKELTGYPENNV